jgi:hypothetical protein
MIFDIEADGLEDATKIHVLAYDTPDGVKYTHDYDEMRSVLTSAKTLIGHNIILYDVPAIERILGITIKARLIDTLALSWYLNHRKVRHGLEVYGEEFGVPKPEINDWENLSKEEYANRCVEDVKINKKLWSQLKTKLLKIYGDKKSAGRLIRYLSFKMYCAKLQQDSKWLSNKTLISEQIGKLTQEQEKKISELKVVMPSVPKYGEKTRPAKPFKKDGTVSATGAKWFSLLKEKRLPKDYDGAVSVLLKEEEPNPNSHEQVKSWLFSLGWQPLAFKFVRNEDGSERKIPQVR